MIYFCSENELIFKKMKTETISLFNNKGGVAKTTSTINIGMVLSMNDKKVLLIDFDPQANLTNSLGLTGKTDTTIYRILCKDEPFTTLSYNENLDVVISELDFSAAEMELQDGPGACYHLKEALETVVKSHKYDYILIDCPPSIGLLTQNALTASNSVLIPVQTEGLAYAGLVNLVNRIFSVIKRYTNPNLKIRGIFATRYNKGKNLNKEVLGALNRNFKKQSFRTIIRENIALAEAPVVQKDIFSLYPKCAGAEDYIQLTNEIFKLKANDEK